MRMSELRIGTSEAKFADMIWSNEPISSGDLAKLAYKEFAWKKTTSFTVLKRLCERGLFQNKNGIVSSIVSKETVCRRGIWGILASIFSSIWNRKETYGQGN